MSITNTQAWIQAKAAIDTAQVRFDAAMASFMERGIPTAERSRRGEIVKVAMREVEQADKALQAVIDEYGDKLLAAL